MPCLRQILTILFSGYIIGVKIKESRNWLNMS
jgi:hypothetical protein